MKGEGPLRDLEAEIADYIERETASNIERGMRPAEARAAAFRRFGNPALVKEDARAVWVSARVDELTRDARYALRGLLRSPVFAAVVVATLGLAIGLSTTVFSVIDAIALRPLSYPAPERLVWVATEDSFAKEEILPRYDYWALRSGVPAFEKMVAYTSEDNTIGTTSRAVQARVGWVSDDFWAVSGAIPDVGRLPNIGEQGVLVLSHDLFERQFDGDASVVGRTAFVDGKPVTVVGVLGRTFRFELFPATRRDPDSKQVEGYVPMVAAPQDQARSRGRPVNVVGRLASAATFAEAKHQVEAMRAALARESPSTYLDGMKLQMIPLQAKLLSGVRPVLGLIAVAVVFVLLVACANVVSLLLARASSREREVALRAALGASHGRLLRQFLVEAALLAGVGGIAGIVLARVCLGTILRLMSDSVPRLAEASIDARSAWFTVLAVCVTTLCFGIAPAVFLSTGKYVDGLRAGPRTGTSGRRALRARRYLVVAQLALACSLLTSAGLLLRGYWTMNAHDARFHPERVLRFKVALSGPRYVEAGPRHAYASELLARLRPMPGVEAVAIAPANPIKTDLTVPGSRVPPNEFRSPTTVNPVSSGYATVMGLQLLAGRWLRDDEPQAAIVVNESFARREFGNADPIGKSVWVQAITPPRVPSFSAIVGVVADMKDTKLDAVAPPQIYAPYKQVPIGTGVSAVVLVSNDPLGLVPTLRGVMEDLDRTQAIHDVKTLDTVLGESIAPRRFTLYLLSVFAAAALILASVGLYGLVAYSVAQERRQIGIRLALGAQRSQIIWQIARDSATWTGIGLGVGLAGAFGLTRLMSGLLYGAEPGDPATFAVVTIVLLASGLLASCGPALEAGFVEPTTALRHE